MAAETGPLVKRCGAAFWSPIYFCKNGEPQGRYKRDKCVWKHLYAWGELEQGVRYTGSGLFESRALCPIHVQGIVVWYEGFMQRSKSCTYR